MSAIKKQVDQSIESTEQVSLYSAFGLTIKSEIPLDTQTFGTTQVADVVVKIADLTNEDKEAINSNGDRHLLGDLPGIAKISIKNGREVLLDPEPGIDAELLSPYILGSAMAVLLQQRGFLVLHASCVVIGDSAIAFIGNSGDGKSTMCSAFHSQGYSILTDDVMVVRVEDDDIWVHPSVPQIKLCPDSADLMNYKGGKASPLHAMTGKKVHRIDNNFSLRPVRLRQIYLLAKGEENEIQPMSVQAGFIELVRHTRAVKTLKSQNLQQSHFSKCTAIAKNVTISRLTRRLIFSELSSLIDLIEENCLQTVKGAK